MAESTIRLEQGDEYPYDASDRWWSTSGKTAPPPPKAKDWAHRAARGIIADLKDRRTIKWSLDGIDEDVRKEIVASLAAIIREAAPKQEPANV